MNASHHSDDSTDGLTNAVIVFAQLYNSKLMVIMCSGQQLNPPNPGFKLRKTLSVQVQRLVGYQELRVPKAKFAFPSSDPLMNTVHLTTADLTVHLTVAQQQHIL